MGIRDFVKAISPPWLIGPGTPNTTLPASAGVAERYMYSLAFGCDALAQKVEDAIKMRFPGVGDPSALPQIGADRRITRGFAESDADYSGRLTRWLTTWRYAGAPRGVLEAVAGYVWSVAPRVLSVLDEPSKTRWDVLPEGSLPNDSPTVSRVTPKNWTWDVYAYVKRRWLVIDAENFSTAQKWCNSTLLFGDPGLLFGSAHSWGFDEPAEVFTTLRTLVRDWASADTRYQWLIVNYSATLFSPTAPAGSPLLPATTWTTWSIIQAGVRPVRYYGRTSGARFVAVRGDLV